MEEKGRILHISRCIPFWIVSGKNEGGTGSVAQMRTVQYLRRYDQKIRDGLRTHFFNYQLSYANPQIVIKYPK